MNRYIKRLVFVCSLFATSAAAAAPASKPFFFQPAVSPDGSRIAFVSGGNIWAGLAGGGAAHILVAGMGDATRPLYSPDGTRLAFQSDKHGGNDIFVLQLDSGAITRITYSDGNDQLDAWSRDGQWLYFDSARDNAGRMSGVYRVRAAGGTPMAVSLEVYRDETMAAPSPDGRDVALVGGGWGPTQWWRHGRAHIDEGAVWLLKDDGSHSYTRITPDDARAEWPMWAPDGRALYYMSDRSGAENLWRVEIGGAESALTHFTSGRVLWPAISADGRVIAFMRDFGIWTVNTANGDTRAVKFDLQGTVAGPGVTHKVFDKDLSNLALSPDGKKVAFIAHGEVFAASSADGGEAERITHTAAEEYGLVWAPDSRALVYGSMRAGVGHLFLYDFVSGRESRLTDSHGEDTHPEFSPDGKQLAFVRDGKSLYVLTLADRQLRKLADANIDLHRPLEFDRPFAWSPDGRWLAYLAWGPRMFRNAWAVALAGGEPRAVSFLANVFADGIAWTPDGKALLFATGQRTEPGQVARVDLVPRTPEFREQQFHNLFQETTPPGLPPSPKPLSSPVAEHSGAAAALGPNAKSKIEPVQIDFNGIRARLALIPIGLDTNAVSVSPDGKQLLLTATVAGRANLYVYSIDPLAKEPPVARQLTSTPGDKADAQYTGDGKQAFYLDDGRIAAVSVADAKSKPLTVSAAMDVDFATVKAVDFSQAWGWLKANYHNADMNGVDWNAVRAEYAPYIAGAGTPAELRRLLILMVGELDSSHSGVYSGARPQFTTGRLGLGFDRNEYERSGRLRIAGIVPLSPAAVSGKIHAGDYLLAVDSVRLNAHSNLDALLDHRIGRETALIVAATADGKNSRSVDVQPVAAPAMAELVYNAWVQRNREYVSRLSGGRLGYVDMPDMSLASLQRLYVDLDAENSTRAGVVVDVRNNYGGFVNAYALDVLARQAYLNMTFRGMSTTAARSVLGQRALERPTVLLINRITLSDGEDFTEGYEEMHLGKVVGEPTAGWIIYTSAGRMLDGSIVRLPFITITTEDGQPMERHPRPVNVPVVRKMGESYRGVDSQLEAAVKTLLTQIGASKPSAARN